VPPKISAGLILFRRRSGSIEVLLAHPGGPFWAGKDEGAWTIPKGEPEDGEDVLAAARREVEEETGARPDGTFIPLDPVRQHSGKTVYAFAVESEFDPAALRSNLFEMEWPPRSGRRQSFPEVDRAEWFTMAIAGRKILSGQAPLLRQLEERLNPDPCPLPPAPC
jgi:predicted NUDIX family NTP pyrophosphohydrolase